MKIQYIIRLTQCFYCSYYIEEELEEHCKQFISTKIKIEDLKYNCYFPLRLSHKGLRFITLTVAYDDWLNNIEDRVTYNNIETFMHKLEEEYNNEIR